jgi:hypothetical protein
VHRVVGVGHQVQIRLIAMHFAILLQNQGCRRVFNILHPVLLTVEKGNGQGEVGISQLILAAQGQVCLEVPAKQVDYAILGGAFAH